MSNSPFRRMIRTSGPDFWRLWYVGLIVATVRWIETVAVGVVVYQRTTAEWKVRMEGGEEIVRTTPPNGHYEAVVKETITNGTPAYAGVFRMGDDTATEYDRVLQVATRLVAYQNSQAASQRMADDHDRPFDRGHCLDHRPGVAVKVSPPGPRTASRRQWHGDRTPRAKESRAPAGLPNAP